MSRDLSHGQPLWDIMRAGSLQRRVSETLGTELGGGPVTASRARTFSPGWSRPPAERASQSRPELQLDQGPSWAHLPGGVPLGQPVPVPLTKRLSQAPAGHTEGQGPYRDPTQTQTGPAASLPTASAPSMLHHSVGLMWPARPAWFSLPVGVSCACCHVRHPVLRRTS